MLGLASAFNMKIKTGMQKHDTFGSDIFWPHFGVMKDVDGYIVR